MAALDTATLLAIGGIGIVILVIMFLIGVLYNSVILWIVSKLFKLRNTKFKTAFLAALVAGAISFVIGIVLQLLIGGAARGAAAAATGAAVAAGLLNMVLSLAATFTVNSLTAKKFYKLETGKSFLVGLVWTVAAIIVGFIVGLVIGAIILAVLLATYSGRPVPLA